jgi:hypothetical protein
MRKSEKVDPQPRVERLTEEELRSLNTEPLPDREVMSTLLWAPVPPTVVAPPLDGVVDEKGV